MVIIVEGMLEDVVSEAAAVSFKLLLRECFRAADEISCHPAAGTVLTQSILYGLYLHVVPIGPERAENASMVRHISVEVGSALPDAHRSKGRRLKGGNLPLIDAIVRDAVETDLAVTPGLCGGPLDALIEISCLTGGEMIDVAGRAPAAAGVDAHDRIACRNPFFRIDDLPVLVFVRRTGGDIGVIRGHLVPGARIAVLEGEPLGIGAKGHDNRISIIIVGAEDIQIG